MCGRREYLAVLHTLTACGKPDAPKSSDAIAALHPGAQDVGKGNRPQVVASVIVDVDRRLRREYSSMLD